MPHLTQESLRLLDAEREFEVWWIARRALGGWDRNRRGSAAEKRPADRHLVDGMMRRKPGPIIGETAILGDLQDHDIGDRVEPRGHARLATEALGLADRHIDRHIGAPALERCDARRRIAHKLDRHPRDGGLAVPVAIIRFEHDAGALLVFRKLVGAAADRLGREFRKADSLDISLGHDKA